MAKIIRTPTSARGGITAAEKAAMDEHVKLWISRAMRTTPIDPEQIGPAVVALYAAAGLPAPRVVIAPSPLVMAFAYGAAAAIWHDRKSSRGATDSAADIATDSAACGATDSAACGATDSAACGATYSATYSATDRSTRSAAFNATAIATRSAIDNATCSAEQGAATACYEMAGTFGLKCASRWTTVYQGGAYWAPHECYLTAARDILGLRLPEHAAYEAWERCAIHGAFRVLHPEFCIVSDFPEIILVDDQNRPHCETGPSHRWRDGWALYHWHGVRIPAEWIENVHRREADLTEVRENIAVSERAIAKLESDYPLIDPAADPSEENADDDEGRGDG